MEVLKEEMPTALLDLCLCGFSYLVVVFRSSRLLVALPALPTRGPVVPLEDLLRITLQVISYLLTGFRALSRKPDVNFV